MSSYYNQNPLQILQYLVSVKGYMQQMNEGQREAEDGQPIQSDDLPTDDIVELKENLPETKDYRDEGNNVDAEKSNKPKDVPSEVKADGQSISREPTRTQTCQSPYAT